MKTKHKKQLATLSPEPHNPYRMRSLEWLLMLFDGGEFLAEVMDGHRGLMRDMRAHNNEHGAKDCKASMTLQISYAMGNSGDVGMGATVTFKPPKKPPSSAGAYITEDGEIRDPD